MVVGPHRRVVAQLRVLDDRVADVDAQAGDPPLEPEAQHLVERRADIVVPPVEVRLGRQELVEVVLARRLVQRPGGAAEVGDPVVRRAAVVGRVGPHVEVAIARVARAERVLEPRVAIARVVGDEVQQHADPAPARLSDQLVEVLERAEVRVDGLVVADVVAPVVVGRREGRVEPDAVDPEPLEVVQARRDAAHVADPVAVGVGERARVDLIQDAVAPPRRWSHGAPGYAPARVRPVELACAP